MERISPPQPLSTRDPNPQCSALLPHQPHKQAPHQNGMWGRSTNPPTSLSYLWASETDIYRPKNSQTLALIHDNMFLCMKIAAHK
jgi:hypothetical protein